MIFSHMGLSFCELPLPIILLPIFNRLSVWGFFNFSFRSSSYIAYFKHCKYLLPAYHSSAKFVYGTLCSTETLIFESISAFSLIKKAFPTQGHKYVFLQ